jgi:sodium-dependent phosphate cotransporter
VAALSLSLLVADVVSNSQLFLLVAGSRLGGAAIVLLIGGLEFLRKRRFSLRRATGLGVLTFLVTLSIYVPATVLGYLALPSLRPLLGNLTRALGLDLRPMTAFQGLTDAVLSVTGPIVGFVLALGLLFTCIDMFDRLLGQVQTDTLRRHFFRRLRQRWVSFGIGLLVTGLTTSVAFSLGVVVPLYNREYVTRREIVPYILGANVGTFLDTLVVAAVLGTTPGLVAVSTLVGAGLVVTLVALAGYGPYYDGITFVQNRLDEERGRFAAFLVVLLATPLVLLLLGLALS